MKLTQSQILMLENAISMQGNSEIIIRPNGRVFVVKEGGKLYIGNLFKNQEEILPISSKTPRIPGNASFREFGKPVRENIPAEAAGILLEMQVCIITGESPRREFVRTPYGKFLKVIVGGNYILINDGGIVKYVGNSEGEEFGVTGVPTPEWVFE